MDAIVTSMRVTHHRTPRFDVPFHDSTMGPFEDFSPSVLRILTAEGLEGLALSDELSGEVIRTTLAPIVLGERVRDWPTLRQRAFWAIRNLGHAGLAMNALSSVDLAVHDLIARIEGKPLWRWLGGTQNRVEVYGSGGGTNLTTDQLVSAMTGLVQRGFRTVKMKIGIDFGRWPADDARRVRAVREAIGPDVALAVDANQCWDASTAIQVARELEPLRIAWIEEPVFAFDRQAAAAVKRGSPIPVAMGESERLGAGFRDLIEHEAVDIVQPQPLCCGGVTGFGEVLGLAAGAGLRVCSSGPSVVACTLLAAARTPAMCEYLVPHNDALRSYFREAPRLDGPYFHLAESPGAGLTLDEEYLRAHPGAAGWERSA